MLVQSISLPYGCYKGIEFALLVLLSSWSLNKNLMRHDIILNIELTKLYNTSGASSISRYSCIVI